MSSSSIYEIIPLAQRPAAERAVREAFPSHQPQSLAPLGGGLSGSLGYILNVAGRQYVLRVLPAKNELNDPERQFVTMKLAAERGVAPPVYYADTQTGASIVGYIPAQPLLPALHARPAVVRSFGELLRRLHDGPAFPTFQGAFELIQGGLNTLARAGVALPALFRTYLEQFEYVEATLRPHLTEAPCHNDLNLTNLLFDGDRIWIVDWESACMNDPFFDLATVIHWFVLRPPQEMELLRAYFGAEPDERQLAKLELMKQVSRCFYAVVFLLLAAQDGQTSAPPMAEREPLASLAEARQAIQAGTLSLRDPADRFRFGLITANEGLHEMRQPDFARAIALLQSS